MHCPLKFLTERLVRGLGVGCLLVGCLLAETSHAQPANRYRYQPAIPTTSPYLNLLNAGGGAANNYYNFVRPQFNQYRVNQAQSAALQQQAQQLRGIEPTSTDFRTQLQAPTAAEPADVPRVTGQSGWFNVPSQRASFSNTSHYFFRYQSPRTGTTGKVLGGNNRQLGGGANRRQLR
jgi:hypothetical protein